MSEFLGALYQFFYTLINDSISTIQNIIEFIANAGNSINNVMFYSLPGMVAIRMLIETIPAPIFIVFGSCICILLVISVLRIFI